MATQSLTGGCHCGGIAYTVDLDLADTLKCNCSICTKLGAVWAFAPRSKFRLKSGEGKLGDYQFGKKHLHHRYCPSCSIESYAEGSMPDGTASVGINLRCIEGVDVDKLSPKAHDGRSL